MRESSFNLADIEWSSALPRYGVDAKHLSRHHGPCPLCGGKDRFRFDNKRNEGTWICNRCGAGNGLTLVARMLNVSNSEALAILRSSSVVVPMPRAFDKKPEISRDELRSKLQRAWEEALPIRVGDPVWKYLHRRIPLLAGAIPGAHVLRHHPGMPYFELYRDAKGRDRYRKIGVFPVMLAKFCSPDGQPVNLHRTYLTPDGGKAPVGVANAANKAKKAMQGVARMTGGAIRLFPVSTRLAVGEGIETMLAVRAASGHTLPVWSCFSAGVMAKFEIPQGVEELHIYADHDLPDEKGRCAGQEAAEQLHKRAVRSGIHAVVHNPQKPGQDFLDQWVEQVAAAYRRSA